MLVRGHKDTGIVNSSILAKYVMNDKEIVIENVIYFLIDKPSTSSEIEISIEVCNCLE